MQLITYYLLLTTSFSGRGEGFCRSYSGLALGYEACGWNPATLAVSPKYSFNIATIGLEYNSNLRFSDYMRLYEGGHFTESDKEMFCGGEELDFLGSAQAISFSYRDLGFMSYAYSHQSFALPEDVTDLIFWGNEIDRTYSLAGISGKSEMGFAMVLSGARVFGIHENFALGGGFKYVYGISYMDVCDSEGSLTTTFYSSDVPKIYGDGKIVYRYADGGYGLGVDLGAFYTIGNYFLGASVINAFSEMVWDIGARRVEMSFKLDPVDLETFAPETSLDWEKQEYKKPFTTSFEPRVDLTVGLKKEQFCISCGSGYPSLFSMGGEVSYGVLVLRSGCALERNRGWLAFGLGIVRNMLHLDVGVRTNSSSRLSGSFSVSIVPSEHERPRVKFY